MAFGILEIDPTCIYINEIDAAGQTVRMPDGKLLRTFVRLPQALVRFDPETNSIWVRDEGPMATGDGVAGDAPREERFEGRCAAHGSFWAASMQPIGSRPADRQTDDRQSPPLAGVFPWDPRQDVAWYALDGTLAIETPCVYIDRVDDSPSWLPGRTDGEPMRLLLRLAQPLVRFDEDTGELWVGPNGPFVHGEKVWLGGGPNAIPGRDAALQVYEGGCSAHEVFWTLNVDAAGP